MTREVPTVAADVAVSGASGLIGRALVRRLRGEGHRVRTLRRGRATGPDDVVWDPERATVDVAALEGVDAVVHLAGEPIAARRWTARQKRRILESRRRGTRTIAEALTRLDRRPRVLVSASAVGIYGDRGDEELTEVSTPGDDFLARVCREWEAATAPAADAGIRTAVVRTGIVLAREGGVLARMLLPFRLGLGGRLGTGEQYTSWISLPDEVGAIVHALVRDDVVGPVNLTAPHPVTNAELTATLARILHRPARVPTPLAPLRLRYGRELVESLLLSGQRVLPARLLATGYRFDHPRLEGALRAVLDRPDA